MADEQRVGLGVMRVGARVEPREARRAPVAPIDRR
jgi:hypothetical protein